MNVLRSMFKSIKRNPVIVVAVVTIGAQAITKALNDGHFNLVTISTYAFQFAMAYVARELVVPGKENEELKEQVSKAIVELEAQYKAKVDAAYHKGVNRGLSGD